MFFEENKNRRYREINTTYFMSPMGKKGWIRITEAIVAILIMSSVLIVMYTKDVPQVSYSDYVYNLQTRILMDVADRDNLRSATLSSTESLTNQTLLDYFDESIPSNFNYTVKVCSLSAVTCNANIGDVPSEIFVEDRIISSNLQKYDPKMLRLYIWEKK